MRFIEILSETNNEIPQELITQFKSDCNYYLTEYFSPQLPLYKGVNENEDRFTVKKIITDRNRKPLNSAYTLHNYLVEIFKELGYTAHRGNSVFCTSNKNMANNYGALSILFPAGDFTFTWSPSFTDFYTDFYVESFGEIVKNQYLGDLATMKEGHKHQIFKKFISDPETYFDHSKMMNFVRTYFKDNTEWFGALKSGNEIIISCDFYYIVNAKLYNDFINQLGVI